MSAKQNISYNIEAISISTINNNLKDRYELKYKGGVYIENTSTISNDALLI